MVHGALCVAVVIFVATACAEGSDGDDAGRDTGGAAGSVVEIPSDGASDPPEESEQESGGTELDSEPSNAAPSAQSGVSVVFEERGGASGPLEGATVGRPFDARLTIADSSIEPVRVTWLIDGDVFRDDDLDAPYTIRYDGNPLPVGEPFASDQGLAGRWTLETGTSHEISAVIDQAQSDLMVSATFSIGEAVPPSSTSSLPPPSTVRPIGGDWPQPGPVEGRTEIGASGQSGTYAVNYGEFGDPWHIHDVDIVADGGNGVGPAEAGAGTMENASVVVNDGGDNIKISEKGVYRNLYLRMSTTGGHIDGMQSQGNSGWVIDNVVIEIPEPSQSITGAVLIENLQGGNRGYADVTGTINRLKLIGTGPYHHDIRLQNNPAATMAVTITNVDWSEAHPDSVLLLTGTPSTLTLYLDDSVPPSRISGAQNATIIRI